jgi:hypothetical protein
MQPAGVQATRAPADEAAEVDGMKTVHVLGGIDGFQDALGIDLRGKRKLDENPVNVVVAIQVFDDGEQIEGGHGGRRGEERAGKAELFAGGDLALDVELRGGILADKDRRETGTNARGGEEANFVTQFGEDLVADFGAVKDARGHSWLAFLAGAEAARPMIAQGCRQALMA